MKKSYLIPLLMIVIGGVYFLIYSCTRTEQPQRTAAKGIKEDVKDIKRDGSGDLTIMDGYTVRSKLLGGDVYEMTINDGLDDTVFVTLESKTPISSDKSIYYTGDGELAAGTFSIPGGPGKYWLVYFDPGGTPTVANGGPCYTITCTCNCQSGNCAPTVINIRDVNEGCCCDGDCIPAENEQCGCATGSTGTVKEPFIIIKADVLVLDQVVYD